MQEVLVPTTSGASAMPPMPNHKKNRPNREENGDPFMFRIGEPKPGAGDRKISCEKEWLTDERYSDTV